MYEGKVHVRTFSIAGFYNSPSAADNSIELAIGFKVSSDATSGSNYSPSVVVEVDSTELFSGTATFASEALSLTSSVRINIISKFNKSF